MTFCEIILIAWDGVPSSVALAFVTGGVSPKTFLLLLLLLLQEHVKSNIQVQSSDHRGITQAKLLKQHAIQVTSYPGPEGAQWHRGAQVLPRSMILAVPAPQPPARQH
jgi:hypothetical protein